MFQDLKEPENLTKLLIGLIPFVFTFVAVLFIFNMDAAKIITDSLPGNGLLWAFLVAVLVKLYSWATKKDPKNYSKKNVEYGSASFGTRKDIKPFVDENPDNNIILTESESLTMNPRPKSWQYARNKNIVVVGGSGAGKTRGYMKPNLMQCQSDLYPCSYIITDPKGGLLVECGKMLQHYGYEIKTINLIDFEKSMKYNPFAYLRTEKDILKLVNVLMLNTAGESKGGDDFWQKAEQLLYCALIGYIHFEAIPEQRNLNTMVFMTQNMETREEDEEFENAIDLIFKELEFGNEACGIKPQPDHFAVRQFKSYKLEAGVICSKRQLNHIFSHG